jgi:hypothetical protein
MGEDVASYDSLDKWLGSETVATRVGVGTSALVASALVEALPLECGDVTEITEWGAQVAEGGVLSMWGECHRDSTCVLLTLPRDAHGALLMPSALAASNATVSLSSAFTSSASDHGASGVPPAAAVDVGAGVVAGGADEGEERGEAGVQGNENHTASGCALEAGVGGEGDGGEGVKQGAQDAGEGAHTWGEEGSGVDGGVVEAGEGSGNGDGEGDGGEEGGVALEGVGGGEGEGGEKGGGGVDGRMEGVVGKEMGLVQSGEGGVAEEGGVVEKEVGVVGKEVVGKEVGVVQMEVEVAEKERLKLLEEEQMKIKAEEDALKAEGERKKEERKKMVDEQRRLVMAGVCILHAYSHYFHTFYLTQKLQTHTLHRTCTHRHTRTRTQARLKGALYPHAASHMQPLTHPPSPTTPPPPHAQAWCHQGPLGAENCPFSKKFRKRSKCSRSTSPSSSPTWRRLRRAPTSPSRT